MKAVKLTLAGKTHHLTYNGEAMFVVQDEFGGAEELLKALEPNDRESFSALCRAVAILAEQGELTRRDLGYEPQTLIGTEELRRLAMPVDILAMKQAIPQAITLGFGREVVPEDDEVDLGLAELDQKKTT